MECKSCGSTKFKRISYHLCECEYCGNEYKIAGVHRTDNTKYIPFQMGAIICDPTRTLFNYYKTN